MNYINEVTTRNELADFLEVSRSKLSYMLYKRSIEEYYTTFEIPKKNGGMRQIAAPTDDLKYIQRRLATALQEYNEKICKDRKINLHISHAFQKGKSFITNAEVHRNKRIVANYDLENFFDSFHFGRVRGYFIKNENFKMNENVATLIAQLTCYKGKLPQGAPTSPIITNLICNIFDIRLVRLARKYRLDYTRYADDLTFSTNDSEFLNRQYDFYKELLIEIEDAGFSINNQKTRVQYKDSRQEVTGLVVNDKVNVLRDYYKTTRAMAHQLYKTGEFFIDDEPGTLAQLEGRFSFINQLDWHNNKKMQNEKRRKFETLNSRERAYKEFLFYKYFYANNLPLIVTEGKTDIIYIRSALKKMWKDYPQLISKDNAGSFHYKVKFLRKTRRLSYFLNIKVEGADTMNNIYQYFTDRGPKQYPNYIKQFQSYGRVPYNSVILLFDNELSAKEKPVRKFIDGKISKEEKQLLYEKNWINLSNNLYILTTPLVGESDQSDIEMLFDEETLNHEINGKKFSKADQYDVNKYYGKEIFSRYVMKNYSKINFTGFRPLLDNIQAISEDYILKSKK